MSHFSKPLKLSANQTISRGIEKEHWPEMEEMNPCISLTF